MESAALYTRKNLPIARAGIVAEISRLGRLSRPTPERQKLMRLVEIIDQIITDLDAGKKWLHAGRSAYPSNLQMYQITRAINEHYLDDFAFGWDQENPDKPR